MPSEGTTTDYKTALDFGGLFFEQPVQIVFAPESEGAFVVERTGRVAVVRDMGNPTRDVFLDLSGRTETTNGGLLSLAFHPRVETRVLVMTADGIYGATYRWNDSQSNASLVAEGDGFQSFEIAEANGSTRIQTGLFSQPGPVHHVPHRARRRCFEFQYAAAQSGRARIRHQSAR